MGTVTVLKGNAAELGGFSHIRVGHELAVPAKLPSGQEMLRTPSGRMFTSKKI